jgi:hypothetical protein
MKNIVLFLAYILIPNLGSSQFAFEPTEVKPHAYSEEAIGVKIEDLNNDGSKEIILLNSPDFGSNTSPYDSTINNPHNVKVFFPNENGLITDSLVLPYYVHPTTPRYNLGGLLEIIDFDNDGLKDIAITYLPPYSPTNFSPPRTIKIFFQTNSDPLEFNDALDIAPETLPLYGNYISMEVDDIDNNGYEDLILANVGTLPPDDAFYLKVIYTYPDHYTDTTLIELPNDYTKILLEDFNNDGITDIIGFGRHTGHIDFLFLENNQVTLHQRLQHNDGIWNSSPHNIDLGDINNDGFLDIAVTTPVNFPQSSTYLHLQDTTNNTFSYETQFDDDNHSQSQLVRIIDIDNDNINEIFVLHSIDPNYLGLPSRSTYHIYKQDVDGVYFKYLINSKPYATWYSHEDVIDFEDLNNDGILDFYICNYNYGLLYALSNNDLISSSTSIENNSLISYYPNPVTIGQPLSIRFSNSEIKIDNFYINLFDLSGHKIYTHNFSSYENHLILPNEITSGLYIMEIYNNNFKEIKKLVLIN